MSDDEPTRERGIGLTAFQQAQKDYPLIDEKGARMEAIGLGEYLVSVLPVYSPAGLMGLAEAINTGSEDGNSQVRDALFTGAAKILAGYVLGYPGNKGFPEEDEQEKKLWEDRYHVEEAYLHDLFEDRSTLEGKQRMGGTRPAADRLIDVVEFTRELGKNGNANEYDLYLDREARERALINLGLMGDDPRKEIIERRAKKERDYIEGAVQAGSRSKGSKKLSFVGVDKAMQGLALQVMKDSAA